MQCDCSLSSLRACSRRSAPNRGALFRMSSGEPQLQTNTPSKNQTQPGAWRRKRSRLLPLGTSAGGTADWQCESRFELEAYLVSLCWEGSIIMMAITAQGFCHPWHDTNTKPPLGLGAYARPRRVPRGIFLPRHVRLGHARTRRNPSSLPGAVGDAFVRRLGACSNRDGLSERAVLRIPEVLLS